MQLPPYPMQVKAHAWFSGFDWEALAAQRMPAPVPPELEAVHIHVKMLPEHLRTMVHAGSKTSALYSSGEAPVGGGK